ncbi:ATP-dependent dethiobiotin synthetase BioD, partial [Pseudomonas sp. HMWF010]
VLLVAGSYLGTVSHVLTALEVVRARGLSVAAIAMSQSLEAPDLHQTAEMLQAFAPGIPVLTVPRAPAWDASPLANLLLEGQS